MKQIFFRRCFMIYLTDSLDEVLKPSGDPILYTEIVSKEEIRKLLRLLKEMNNLLRMRLPIFENCIKSDVAANKLSKILKREVIPNKDFTPKLEKGDVIIHFTLLPKPMFYIVKVKDI
jgi:hypothetical protein